MKHIKDEIRASAFPWTAVTCPKIGGGLELLMGTVITGLALNFLCLATY